MLHTMSMVRGWSHDEMMKMSKRIFYRYFGYWYADKFNESLDAEWREHKNKLNEKSQKNREALGIRN